MPGCRGRRWYASPRCADRRGGARDPRPVPGRHRRHGFAGAATWRLGTAEADTRQQRRNRRHGADTIRDNRNGDRGYAAWRNGLRDETISCGGIALQAGPLDSFHRGGSGESFVARGIAQQAWIWRPDRHVAADAARVQADPEGIATQLSRLDSRRERDGERAGRAVGSLLWAAQK